MKRARIVASCSMNDPGGVAAVCRSMELAFREKRLVVEHLNSRDCVELSRLARAFLGRRHLQGVAEALMSWRAVADEPEADLIVTNGPIGLGIHSATSVHFYHGTHVEHARAVRAYIRELGYLKLRYLDAGVLERLAGRRKVCLANSRQTAREVREYFGHECDVVWCEVDTDAFRPGRRDRGLLHVLGLSDEKPVGLFVGAGRAMKGAATAYRVIADLPEINWLVLGDVHDVPGSLRRDIAVRDGVPHAAMPALLRSVDVVLAPSIYEPFGILIAESLASGTPVVLSAQGVAELVSDIPGFGEYILEDPTGVVGAVERVRTAVGGREEASRTALAARERIHETLAPSQWRRRFLGAVGLECL